MPCEERARRRSRTIRPSIRQRTEECFDRIAVPPERRRESGGRHPARVDTRRGDRSAPSWPSGRAGSPSRPPRGVAPAPGPPATAPSSRGCPTPRRSAPSAEVGRAGATPSRCGRTHRGNSDPPPDRTRRKRLVRWGIRRAAHAPRAPTAPWCGPGNRAPCPRRRGLTPTRGDTPPGTTNAGRPSSDRSGQRVRPAVPPRRRGRRRSARC